LIEAERQIACQLPVVITMMPDHFSRADMNDWVNFERYGSTQLLLNGTGCLFWLFAYVVLVARIYKNRFVEMPALVAGANFGWEIVWSVWFHPSTGAAFSIMYMGAALIDVFIFASVLRFGIRQLATPPRPAIFAALCLLNVVFWAAVCYHARSEGLDDELGARSGYIINVVLSFTSVTLMLRMADWRRFSLWFGVFRTLGTGLISASMLLIYPRSRALHLLCAACTVLDGYFVARLAWEKRHARTRAADSLSERPALFKARASGVLE
jgi:hypothetical protein